MAGDGKQRQRKALRTRTKTCVASLAVMAICAVFAVVVAMPASTLQTDAANAKNGEPSVAPESMASAPASSLPTQTEADTLQGASGDDPTAYEPGFMLAELADGVSADEAAQALSALPELSTISVADVIDDLVRFELPEGVSVQRATELASTVDAIDAAQPNYRYYVAAADGASVDIASQALAQAAANRGASLAGTQLGSALSAQSVPNDPYYDDEWHLKSIKAPEAWASLESAGSNPEITTVAVIDSGFSVKHEDIAGNVVDVYNATTREHSILPDNMWSSKTDHGTICAGIISAVTNNGIGVASVTNNACKVLPVRVENSSGSIYTSYVAEAYSYLILKKDEYNIRVASISLGVDSKSVVNRSTDKVLYDCMKKSYNAGILSVAAACNDDGAEPPYYAFPADFDNIVSVIALTQTTANADGVTRASYSNYNKGAQIAKNISAPGTSIYSSFSGRNSGPLYGSSDGTSMATPVTAGVLGLMFAASPNLTAGEAVSKLYSSARDLTKCSNAKVGWDKVTGFGEVDAEAAVDADQPYLSGSLKVQVGKAKTLSVKVKGKKQASSSWQWKSSNTAVATVDANGKVTGKTGGRVIISATKDGRIAQQVITVQVPASELTVKLSKTKYTYSGSACKPEVTVEYNGKKLEEGHDYTVSYKNNVNAGKGTVTITGVKPYYTDSAKKTFTIAKRTIAKANIKLSARVLPYNGKAQKPTVVVYDIGKNKKVKLKQGVHYKVTGKGVVKGKGKLTITAKKACANFTGSVVKTFRVE